MTDWLARGQARLAVHQRGAGLPVVFQHGLCGDARQTLEAFPDPAAYRLLTLECRGHGQSDMSGPYSIAQFSDDVMALIGTLNGPVVLGGISMGAAIAMRIAVIRPDLVRGLILVRPAWVTDAAPQNMEPNAEVGRLIATLGAEARARFAASLTAARLAVDAPDNLASLMGFFDRHPLAQTAALLQSIAADGPGITKAQLSGLRLPRLICGTTGDAIHPLSHVQELAHLIPGAAMVTLPPKGRDKTAHLAALHAAITAFLKEC